MEQIGPFRVEKELPPAREHSLEERFLARGPSGETVVIERSRYEPSEAGRMFRHAARILERAAGRGAQRLVASELDAERPWLALERIPGEGLDRLLARGREEGGEVPPSVAVALMRETARALEQLAELGIGLVHRELTPSSILVGHDGRVRLRSFYTARSALQEERTESGVIRGPLAYLAPEQTRPGTPIDARADLFTLATTLREVISGANPWARENVVLSLFAIERNELEPLDHPLWPAIARCHMKSPTARFDDATALIAALPESRAHLGEWARSLTGVEVDAFEVDASGVDASGADASGVDDEMIFGGDA